MDRPKRYELAGLPDEAILEILARAPFRSVCSSKCVAKSWRDLIDDPLNRGRLPQTLEGFFSIFLPDPALYYSRRRDPEHFFVKYLASPVPLDIDTSLSFLVKRPEIVSLYFVDYCNGLLFFEHCLKWNPFDVLGYIVCNPATKHWATVPICGCCPPPEALSQMSTYLVFDPARAISPHFHLIQFWRGGVDEVIPLELSVHTYSSESGVWSHNQTDWNEQGQLEGWRHQGRLKYGCHQRTFVNGILHLIVSGLDRYQIVAVDVQGKTKRIIATPDAAEGRQWNHTPCIGQSQGCLRYINQDFDSSELSIWELEDYDTQEWVLKDTVSFLSLFGKRTDKWKFVVIHPDRNVVFFVGPLNRLIAYDMDRKEVSVVSMLSEENLYREIVPYVPYFSESPALTNKD